MDAPDTRAVTDAASQVTELYKAHALGLVRLAVIMLGDRGQAEDVVQDAFFGLYRRWAGLSDAANALPYVRSSVLNGCRTALRRQARRLVPELTVPDAESAEALVLLGEEHREVLAALRRLPDRQREAVVLRYCLGMPEDEAAQSMGISRGTVKSATSRGIAALGRMLREQEEPLAAAAAVIAVAAVLVAVRNLPDRRPVPPAAPESTQALPEYYVALVATGSGGPGQAIVGDTRTGARLATVSPPAHRTFGAVSGAADDRTFVLDTNPFPVSDTQLPVAPRTFYLLRVAPGTGHPAQLTRLPIPATPAGDVVDGMTLSPDGSKLAVMVQAYGSSPGPPTLLIYSVPAGWLLGSWTAPKAARPPGSELAGQWLSDSSTSLSWTDGGHQLTFFYAPGVYVTGVLVLPAPGMTIRALDPSRPGHDLLADSRVVLVLRSYPADSCDSMLVTADGRSVICGTYVVSLTAKPGFAVYSTVTGRLTGFLYRYPGSVYLGEAAVFWASPSGDTLVGSLFMSVLTPKHHVELKVGVFTRGKFRPLTGLTGLTGLTVLIDIAL